MSAGMIVSSSIEKNARSCDEMDCQKIARVADLAQTSTELFGFGPRLPAKERRLLFHEAVDPTGTTEVQAMNPPHMMTTTTISPLAAERSMASQAVLQDDLCDLTLDEPMTPEDLVYGLWSLTSGAYTIAMSSESLPQLGIKDPFASVRRHRSALLDGFGWKPFSNEFDLPDLVKQIESEVFSDV